MNYNLKKPCANCPFRDDIDPFITQERAEEIAESLSLQQLDFPCHKTVDYSGDDGGRIKDKSEMCAGAMIMLEKEGRPTQMMRISERLGMYDASSLEMDSAVYSDCDEFVEAHEGL